MSNITKSKNGKYPIPAIASFFIPGLGQLLKGHLPKAGLFFGIYVAWWLLLGTLLSWIPIIGWIIGPALLLINVLDAFVSDHKG